MEAPRRSGSATTRPLRSLGHDRDEEIVKAGEALSVLDEGEAHDEVKFFHQLIQEYFAGRRLAASPEPERVRASWKAAEIVPPLVEVLRIASPGGNVADARYDGLGGDGAPGRGDVHLPGRIRAGTDGYQPRSRRPLRFPERVSPKLSPGLLDELRRALVGRSRDREADLRSRIEAGLALGPLGDPRCERRKGPHADYLMPALADIPAGRYPMGEDEPFENFGDSWTAHMPRHEVEIEAFRIGRFPVTNAEWALFMEAGGYEEERWWDTEAAVRWQRGEGTTGGSTRRSVTGSPDSGRTRRKWRGAGRRET